MHEQGPFKGEQKEKTQQCAGKLLRKREKSQGLKSELKLPYFSIDNARVIYTKKV